MREPLKFRFATRLFSGLLSALIAGQFSYAQALPLPQPFSKYQGTAKIKPMFSNLSDPSSSELSYDALQMAKLLGVEEKLRRLIELRGSAAAHHDEILDLKFDILDTVEETRLQIDFVQAEIEEEMNILEEAGRVFRDERDDRVNRANQLAFRTNGILWTVAEALSIPTFKKPRLSVPSGSVGIIAGIVPSIFSEYAVLAGAGNRYIRRSYPNILTGLYDLPIIARITFPDIVWQYLNSRPSGETASRKEIMRETWLHNENIHVFKGGIDEHKIKLLTGNEPYTASLDLVSDKLIMLGQVKTVVLQMSRPLLEIWMVARGKKNLPAPAPVLNSAP